MSGKSKIKVGDRYGFVTIIAETDKRRKNGACYFICKCDCGNTFERCTDSIFQSIKKGCIISCGCKQKEKASKQGKKSNYSNNPELQKLAVESLKQYDDTCIIQLQRKKVNKNSSTGVRGVSYSNDKTHKYRVRLQLKGKEILLGYADTLEEGREIRKRGEEKYYQPVIESYERSVNESKTD